MLVASGEPKIMDFGIAKLEAGQHTSPGQFFGTPLFMSPEQALGQPVDGRTDLFSLGSVAYFLLSGRPPFEAPNVPGILARVAYQHPKPLRDLVPGLPADVEYVVTRAMAKNPADRFPDGKTMAEDIEDILAGRPPRHRDRLDATADRSRHRRVRARGGAPRARRSIPIEARPRRRRRTTFRLVLLLGLVSAVYFYLHPSDWQFWRRAAREARKSRIADEVRAWWGRVGVESPEAPSAPIAAPATPRRRRPPRRAPVPSPSRRGFTGPPAFDLGGDREHPGGRPGPGHVAGATARIGAGVEAGDSRRPSSRRRPALPAELAIEFEHHLKHGNLQVWVDDARVVNDDFDGRITRKILSFELRKGLVQQRLALDPGGHSVRVTVRWDDNTKTARISGAFRPGVARKLDVDVEPDRREARPCPGGRPDPPRPSAMPPCAGGGFPWSWPGLRSSR